MQQWTLWLDVLHHMILFVMQHESLALLKEMLYALDLALFVGTTADKKAADRLQRRCLPCLCMFEPA